jgi:serine acetyltransferase
MVGALAVATRDVRAWHVNVGIPAKSVRVKPNAPPEAYKTTICGSPPGGGESTGRGGAAPAG